MVVSLFFMLIHVSLIDSFYLPDSNIQNNTAEEIQHAVCKITSKDLQATANATIFRELRGVCTSVEVKTLLQDLEVKIVEEINEIKTILQHNGFKIPEVKIAKKSFDPIEVKKYEQTPEEHILNNIDYKDLSNKLITKLKDSDLEREKEINTYNNSVIESNKGNIYFYYWNILNIKEVLIKAEMYIISPSFFVLGHSVNLHFYPNYIKDECFAIHLSASSKGFVKKHKIYILNHRHKNKDINSGIMFGFKGEDSMFKVSNTIIHERGYIKNNGIIVKLEILLNS